MKTGETFTARSFVDRKRNDLTRVYRLSRPSLLKLVEKSKGSFGGEEFTGSSQTRCSNLPVTQTAGGDSTKAAKPEWLSKGRPV